MGDECATRERGGERRERRTKASFHDALLLYRRALPVNLEQSSPESSEQLSVLVFVMPRRSRADDGPLLVLGDGVERMMRMARQPEEPAEQQEEEAAPTDDEGGASPLDVQHHVAQGGAADPFAFPGAGAGEEGDGEEEVEQVLEAVEVDGRMAGEEDAAEVEAAEHVVAQGEAADDEVAAQALQEAADTEPEEEAQFERPVVRFVPAARGKGGKKGPKRHRKVLRYVSRLLTCS